MTINYRIIYQFFKMTLFSALLIGCAELTITPSPEQMDKSPFTGDPCVAPCWYGLRVAESSENETLSKISTLTFIDPSSIQLIRENSAPGLDPKDANFAAQIVANCVYPEKQCLVLRTVGYTLTRIELILNYEITIQESIGYLGVPDYVGYQNIGHHPFSCEINIVWQNRQLILATELFEGREAAEKCGAVQATGKVEADLLLSQVKYESPEAIAILLVAGSGTEFFDFTETLP